jgi:hypothetical protein
MRVHPGERQPDPIYQPSADKSILGLDLLKIPLLGNFIRHRWGRLSGQLVLLSLALLMIYDGFTGPQLALRTPGQFSPGFITGD